MFTRWPILSRVLRTAFLGGVLGLTLSLAAADGGFSSTLSAEQKNAAGLTVLSAAESAALDQLIATDVGQARKENSSQLEGTFTARRTEAERQQSGLNRLTPAQLTALDARVAVSVAASPKPKERPRIKDSDVFSAPIKPEVHGEFSLTYGRGSGGSNFRAASMWVDYFDPNTGLGLSVGLTQSSGKGWFGFYPGDSFGPNSMMAPGFGYTGSPYRSYGSNNWFENEERSIGASWEWNNNRYRDFRHP